MGMCTLWELLIFEDQNLRAMGIRAAKKYGIVITISSGFLWLHEFAK